MLSKIFWLLNGQQPRNLDAALHIFSGIQYLPRSSGINISLLIVAIFRGSFGLASSLTAPYLSCLGSYGVCLKNATSIFRFYGSLRS